MNKNVVIFLVFLASCSPFYRMREKLPVEHILIKNSDAEIIWSKSFLYLYTGENGSMLVGAPGRVLAQGMEYPSRSVKIYAFDTATGELAWDAGINLPSSLVVNDSILYRGGYDIVQTFDTRDGKMLWETTLPRAGNAVYIFYLSDQVFLHTSSGRSYAVDLNGQLINSTDPDFAKTMLVSDGVVYINKFDQIEAIDPNSGEIKWQTALGDFFLDGPIFSDDMIYIRTKGATIPGVIYALDQNNGQVVWKTRGNVISNFCILDSSLFYLTVEGYLIGVDQKTGEQTKALEFSPRPFILPDPGIMVGGYYVATDPVNHTIAVSLGDSLQLFAIKINK